MLSTAPPSTTLATRTEITDEHVNKIIHKPLTGKAKRDEINKKDGGSEMDVFTDTDSVVKYTVPATETSAVKQPLTGLTSDIDCLKTPESENNSSEESQKIQPNEIEVYNPSNEEGKVIDPDHGSDNESKPSKTETPEPIQVPLEQEFNTNTENTNSHLNNVASLTNSLQELGSTGQNINHVNPNLQTIEPDHSITAINIETEAPIVENGFMEKGPILKYDYKPGRYFIIFLSNLCGVSVNG